MHFGFKGVSEVISCCDCEGVEGFYFFTVLLEELQAASKVFLVLEVSKRERL